MVPTIPTGFKLAAVKDGKFPFPDAANPMFILEFCHANVVPAIVPVKGIAGVISALQYVTELTGFTVGTGDTIICASADCMASHPLPLKEIVTL